jgi:DNA modification methylase
MTFIRKEVIEQCTLYLGDCLEVLPSLGKATAIVTDPPYGINQANGMGGGGTDASGRYKRKPKTYAGSWDDVRPSEQAFSLLLSAGHRHIIWGGNYFADYLPPSGRWLFWDKLNSMPSYSDGEMAWSSLDGNSVKKFTYCSNGLASKRDGERQHPTQKPVALMSWCLSFLPAGSSIMDPFMGSGTTGVACVKAGMPFVGIERDETYFEIACQRIRNAHAQSDFFAAPMPTAPAYDQKNMFGGDE